VKFFKNSSKELNFYVWNEVANGFTVILSQIFPPCLNKYLADYYKYHLKKYAKERIKKEKKLYDSKRAKEETRKQNGKMTVFSTSNENPCRLTEQEYFEIMN